MQILKLKVFDAPPIRWTRWAASCGASVFQSPEWIDANLRPNGEPKYFVWMGDDDTAIGLAAGQILTSSIPVLGKHGSILEMSSLPALVEEQRVRGTDFIESLAQYAADSDCRLLTIESQDSQAIRIKDHYLGARLAARLELELKLDGDEETLWSGLHAQHRRKIRKARKQDLQIDLATDDDEVLAFRELQQCSRERREERGDSGEEIAGDIQTAVIRKTVKSGLGELYLARRGDEIVSGALIISYLGRSFYVYGGSNATGFKTNAPALLFWEAITRALSRGNKAFNFGGVPAGSDQADSESHGLYRFKAGFGCEQRPLADLELSIRPWTHRMIELLGALRSAA